MSYRWFECLDSSQFYDKPETTVSNGLKWLKEKLSYYNPPVHISDVEFVLCEAKMFWSRTDKCVTKQEMVDILRKEGCVHVQARKIGTVPGDPRIPISDRDKKARNDYISVWLEFESKEKHDADEEWMSTSLQKEIDDHVRKTGDEKARICRGDGKVYNPSPDALAEGIAAKKEREEAKRKDQNERSRRSRLKKKNAISAF